MQPAERSGTNNLKIVLAYLLMIGGVIVAYSMIRSYGDGLTSRAPIQAAQPSTTAAASSSPDVALHVLLALIVVIVTARTLGSLFVRSTSHRNRGDYCRSRTRPVGFGTSRSERGVLRAPQVVGCAIL